MSKNFETLVVGTLIYIAIQVTAILWEVQQ